MLLKRTNIILLATLVLAFSLSKNTRASSEEKSEIVIPSSLQSQLDSLHRADLLEDWLNCWYGYLSQNPSAHYEELEIPLKTIWRDPGTPSEQAAWLWLMIFIGYYELQQGNILLSTTVYEKTYLLIQQSTAIESKEVLEYLIKPLGNNYTRLGDYNRALFIQNEGLKLAEKLNDSMQEAALLANMSTTARWNNQLEKALFYSNEGLKKVESGTPLKGLLLSTKADILQEEGDLKQADLVIHKAIQLFTNLKINTASNDAYWRASALMIAGMIAQKKQKAVLAKSLLQKALSHLNKDFPHSKSREKLKIKIALSQVLTKQGKFIESLALLNGALSGLLPIENSNKSWPPDQMLYAENTLLDALLGKAENLHFLGSDSLALIGYQKAAGVMQKLRVTIFSKDAKRLLQQQSLQNTESAIQLAYQLYQKTQDSHYATIALQFAEQQKARLLLDDIQKNKSRSATHGKDSLTDKQNRLNQAVAFYFHSYLDAILQKNSKDSLLWKQKISAAEYELSLIDRQLSASFPSTNFQEDPDLSHIFHTIPVGTVVWEYFAGNKDWFGFAITTRGIIQFRKLGRSEPLTAATAGFFDDWFLKGPTPMINNPKKYYRHAFTLYRKLKLKTPPGFSRLHIIPDGILGKIPFEALLTDSVYHTNPAKWPYLLQKAVTSQNYSLSVWYQLQKNSSSQKRNKGFAGFFIDPDESSNLATLEGVHNEEKKISSLIRGDFFQNRKATGRLLSEALKNEEVIHISTHAFLMGEEQIPALQMADKKIVPADLYPLQAHPSLIVLSACQTAGGLLSKGEGIISLAREFTAIGAGGVISAMWNINDETAAQLTALFYKNLKKSGKKAFSLHQTKKEWLEDGQMGAVMKLPYYWAGMVYYGNNVSLAHPLESRSPFIFPVWGWGLSGVLFALIIWVFYRKFSKRK